MTTPQMVAKSPDFSQEPFTSMTKTTSILKETNTGEGSGYSTKSAMESLTKCQSPLTTSSESMPETVLEEANRIIYGDREKTYGNPAKNFVATACLWQGYLKAKAEEQASDFITISALDVAHMMILLKMARELHMHKRDNVVDMAGYAGCIQKMEDYKNV